MVCLFCRDGEGVVIGGDGVFGFIWNQWWCDFVLWISDICVDWNVVVFDFDV